jgi:hypothetical protein
MVAAGWQMARLHRRGARGVWRGVCRDPPMDDSGPIMLIRHAEKPLQDEAAVSSSGHADPLSLSVRGWQRAGALVPLFAGSPPLQAVGPGGHRASAAIEKLARPQHLLAARATADRPSTRPRDTLRPVAQFLGLTIDENFSADSSLATLATHIRGLKGPVLVCWRHDALPALANELLQRMAAPVRWPESSFDMVWVIERTRLSWELVQVPQRLLHGDTTHARRRVPARR